MQFRPPSPPQVKGAGPAQRRSRSDRELTDLVPIIKLVKFACGTRMARPARTTTLLPGGDSFQVGQGGSPRVLGGTPARLVARGPGAGRASTCSSPGLGAHTELGLQPRERQIALEPQSQPTPSPSRSFGCPGRAGPSSIGREGGPGTREARPVVMDVGEKIGGRGGSIGWRVLARRDVGRLRQH